MSEAFDLKRPSGVVVTSVIEKGPAARAGLKTGDVIVAIDDQAVDDPNAFDYRFATHPLGGKVDLGIMRGGKESKIAIALETAPESAARRDPDRGALAVPRRQGRQHVAGAGRRVRLDPSTEGVAMVDIADGTMAQQFGFQRGDIVLAVNGSKIDKTRDLEKVAKAGARVWRITIQRGGQQISAVFGG